MGDVDASARYVGRCRDFSPKRIDRRIRPTCATGDDLGAKISRRRDSAFYYLESHVLVPVGLVHRRQFAPERISVAYWPADL
jgi:hypothetical protein